MRLYRTLDAVMPRFREVFRAVGLTEPQWRVLRVLWAHPNVSIAQLAAKTLIGPPSLVGVVDRLETRGLVVRQRSSSDRRIVHVCATERGQVLESEMRPKVDKIYADLEAGVDPQIWAQVCAGLDAMANAYSRPQSPPAHGASLDIAGTGRNGEQNLRNRPNTTD